MKKLEVKIRYYFRDKFDSVLDRANRVGMARDFVNKKYGGTFVSAEFSSEGVRIDVGIKAEYDAFLENLFRDYIAYEINNGSLTDFIRGGINRSRLKALWSNNNSVYIKSPNPILADNLLERQGFELKRELLLAGSGFKKVIPIE